MQSSEHLASMSANAWLDKIVHCARTSNVTDAKTLLKVGCGDLVSWAAFQSDTSRVAVIEK